MTDQERRSAEFAAYQRNVERALQNLADAKAPTISKNVGFGWMVLGLAILTPAIVLEGWIITLTWEWFVVPLGASAIGIAHAIGLNVLLSLFFHRYRKTPDDAAAVVKHAYTAPLWFLAVGWVAHLVM